MTYDYNTLPHTGIQKLHPYIPGKATDTLTHEQGINHVIKLASNENPLGCSPTVLEAFAQLTPHDIATYPISRENPLRARLAQHTDLHQEAVMLSNGSDILFHLLLECFALHTNKHVLTHDYAFITYEVQANTLGIPIRKVPLQSNWEVDIDGIINACTEKTALIFLANPNNPTGLIIKPEAIEHLLDNIPESTLLVLDEAYHEYTPANQQSHAKTWLNKYPNLVITRTFSKVYGLASLRLGYALANPDIIALLHRIQLPFTVSLPSMRAGIAALDDQTFADKSIQLNQEGLLQVKQVLDKLELNSLPTAGNFITFDCGRNATALDQHLQARGIITRPLTPYGLSQHLRVTIGTFEQNTRFLNALPLCLKETVS
ncbi:MAG: histidinol-phosphate transaminase [Gammaproteobacteria bacterium]|nr:histidinol-phosphate transaminase [Gammaproteobacteria bacterium]MCH9718147.1 histidinol-phosphate transaminase [Gammaproteobacteria bacterium]MCH9762835.1 histidinol-phosphate transaminase [Gammaproteobacteria bacterium]